MRIKPAPYLYGISITINIGSVLTPFSSSKNILIASQFNLDFLWFIKNMGLFTILALVITLILMDLLITRHLLLDLIQIVLAITLAMPVANSRILLQQSP